MLGGVGRSWTPLVASVLLGACATAPAETTPVATPSVRTTTTIPTTVQPSAVEANAVATAVQRPEVDLGPPSPMPLLSLNRQDGGNDSSADYLVELNPDGTGRFIGHSSVCLKGEISFRVPGATVEEARRLLRASHLFEHPLPPCSQCCVVDAPPVAIYFWEPLPGRMVDDTGCPLERREVRRLAAALDRLLRVEQWVGEADNYGNCRR